MACMRFGEIPSCCSLTLLLSPAWIFPKYVLQTIFSGSVEHYPLQVDCSSSSSSHDNRFLVLGCSKICSPHVWWRFICWNAEMMRWKIWPDWFCVRTQKQEQGPMALLGSADSATIEEVIYLVMVAHFDDLANNLYRCSWTMWVRAHFGHKHDQNVANWCPKLCHLSKLWPKCALSIDIFPKRDQKINNVSVLTLFRSTPLSTYVLIYPLPALLVIPVSGLYISTCEPAHDPPTTMTLSSPADVVMWLHMW